jgi:hypothetical protein
VALKLGVRKGPACALAAIPPSDQVDLFRPAVPYSIERLAIAEIGRRAASPQGDKPCGQPRLTLSSTWPVSRCDMGRE